MADMARSGTVNTRKDSHEEVTEAAHLPGLVVVIINSLVFIMFAFSFTHPRHPRLAIIRGSRFHRRLFTEMYGFR
jgi:hypothetical protein